MRTAAILLLAALTAGACTPAKTSGLEQTEAAERPSTPPTLGIETPVSDDEAARLSREFGLADCSEITRLRDHRAQRYFAESWRVRDGTQCFNDFADRQERYSLLAHLDASQAERDRLPWLCDEDGAHVAQCSSQGQGVILLIEQPRYAEYLLLRRIRKVAG